MRDFDLIVFDRFANRGILPPTYLRNIADYVRGGGALLLGLSWGALHGWIVPRIGEFRPALESRATRLLGVPVRIGAISARSAAERETTLPRTSRTSLAIRLASESKPKLAMPRNGSPSTALPRLPPAPTVTS